MKDLDYLVDCCKVEAVGSGLDEKIAIEACIDLRRHLDSLPEGMVNKMDLHRIKLLYKTFVKNIK